MGAGAGAVEGYLLVNIDSETKSGKPDIYNLE
jgi:hypothetical protein